MKPQNELALIVAYYLSRLDRPGYLLLGFSSFNDAKRRIGEILDVKPNTVKNMRDEFDPYHRNSRVGWKRALRGSRLKVLEAFQTIDDESLFEIVKEILNNSEFITSKTSVNIRSLLNKEEKNKKKTPTFLISRGTTGKAAEEFYKEYFETSAIPVKGILRDTRDLGCGYDFEIRNGKELYFIEIKGLFHNSGGVLFTNKEWQTAIKHGKKYYLIIIKNISSTQKIIVIQNPASKLKAVKKIYPTIQVSWGVSEKILNLLSK